MMTYLTILMCSRHGWVFHMYFRRGSRIKTTVRNIHFWLKIEKKYVHTFSCPSCRYLSVDCSVATQQVKIKVMLEATKEFCETVGIVGYLSSRDDRAQPLWPILPNSAQNLCFFSAYKLWNMAQYSSQSHLFNEYGEKCQFNQRKMNQNQIFCVLEGHKCIIMFGQNLEIPDIVPAYLLT